MSKSVAILDFGLNLELAFVMAKAGYDVGYYCEAKRAYPEAKTNSIGAGFDEFTKLTNLNDAFDYDIIVCPDTHSAHWVELAKRLGKPVFGAGESEIAEHDRSYFKKLLKRLNLPVGAYSEAIGTEALEKTLRQHKDRYVKLDGDYRGDMETFHHKEWATTRDEVWGHLLTRLGANSQECPFVIEEPLESECEVGFDGLVVDGKYSQPSMVGFEAKDAAHIGHVFDKLPSEMQLINDKFAPLFKEWKARTFYSNEIRITKEGKWYSTDPCIRTGHPVFATETEIISNLGNVVAEAASGRLVAPVYSSNYTAALLVKSSNLHDGWIRGIKIPNDLRHLIKLQNATCHNGVISIIPESFIACTAVGCGDTVEEAVETAIEVAEAVEVDGKYVDYQALKNLQEKTIPEAEKFGIKF